MLDWLVAKLCKPGSVVWGNCCYAFLLYATRGGQIIISRSESLGIIPSCTWTDQLPPNRCRRFIPLKRRYGWKAIFFCLIFKGKWVKQVIHGGMLVRGDEASLQAMRRGIL